MSKNFNDSYIPISSGKVKELATTQLDQQRDVMISDVNKLADDYIAFIKCKNEKIKNSWWRRLPLISCKYLREFAKEEILKEFYSFVNSGFPKNEPERSRFIDVVFQGDYRDDDWRKLYRYPFMDLDIISYRRSTKWWKRLEFFNSLPDAYADRIMMVSTDDAKILSYNGK